VFYLIKLILIIGSVLDLNRPIVTAQVAIEHKKMQGEFEGFIPPSVILICYQKSTLKYFLETRKDIQKSDYVEGLYLVNDGRVAILGGFGIGAPALACKVEQLIALGSSKFIAVGTAGTLESKFTIGQTLIATKAYANDGVSEHYLNGQEFAFCHPDLCDAWKAFEQEKGLHSQEAISWTFSAIFKETPKALNQALNKGCDVVEMEIATLYELGTDKNVQTLTLLVVSDDVKVSGWNPQFKSDLLKINLHNLADRALIFCMQNVEESAVTLH